MGNTLGNIVASGKIFATEGLTFGYAKQNIHCTTVHFAQKFRTGTRGSNNSSDLDLATSDTNMTSDDEPFGGEGYHSWPKYCLIKILKYQ